MDSEKKVYFPIPSHHCADNNSYTTYTALRCSYIRSKISIVPQIQERAIKIIVGGAVGVNSWRPEVSNFMIPQHYKAGFLVPFVKAGIQGFRFQGVFWVMKYAPDFFWYKYFSAV